MERRREERNGARGAGARAADLNEVCQHARHVLLMRGEVALDKGIECEQDELVEADEP